MNYETFLTAVTADEERERNTTPPKGHARSLTPSR